MVSSQKGGARPRAALSSLTPAAGSPRRDPFVLPCVGEQIDDIAKQSFRGVYRGDARLRRHQRLGRRDGRDHEQLIRSSRISAGRDG